MIARCRTVRSQVQYIYLRSTHDGISGYARSDYWCSLLIQAKEN